MRSESSLLVEWYFYDDNSKAKLADRISNDSWRTTTKLITEANQNKEKYQKELILTKRTAWGGVKHEWTSHDWI